MDDLIFPLILAFAVVAFIFNLKFYIGYPGWGWSMWGIGYKTKWFLGFSYALPPSAPEAVKLDGVEL